MVKDNPITNVSCLSLEMGTAATWQGYPDGRVMGHSLSSIDVIYGNDEGDPDTCLTGLNESQGDTVCVWRQNSTAHHKILQNWCPQILCHRSLNIHYTRGA